MKNSKKKKGKNTTKNFETRNGSIFIMLPIFTVHFLKQSARTTDAQKKVEKIKQFLLCSCSERNRFYDSEALNGEIKIKPFLLAENEKKTRKIICFGRLYGRLLARSLSTYSQKVGNVLKNLLVFKLFLLLSKQVNASNIKINLTVKRYAIELDQIELNGEREREKKIGNVNAM